MIRRPLVSVIVPNFNHALFLERRIESILNQTYENFELIILDDHSSDDSRTVIESYRDHPKVAKIYFNEINSGSPFRQWEKGVAFSSGEFIWIAESDDMADTTFLEKTVICGCQSGSGIIYTDSYQIDEKDQQLNRWSDVMAVYGNLNIWNESFTKAGIELLSTLHPITNTIPNASGVVIRKSLISPDFWAQVKDFKYAGDWLFWGLCFAHSTVSYIHEPLNFFRTHSNTTRSKKAYKKSDLDEYYYCILQFRPYLKNELVKLFNENLDYLFQKWHYGSLKYFLENFSWKRYAVAKKVDPAVNKRIVKFLMHTPRYLMSKIK